MRRRAYDAASGWLKQSAEHGQTAGGVGGEVTGHAKVLVSSCRRPMKNAIEFMVTEGSGGIQALAELLSFQMLGELERSHR